MKQINGLKRQGGWVQYAVAGVSAAVSLIGGSKGAQQAKKIGKENEALIILETAETLRRMELSQKQLVGEANIRASASGFTKKGSIADYFDELDSEYQNRVDWEKRSSAQRIKVALAGGGAASSQSLASGFQGALGAGMMAAGWYNS